MYRKIAKDTKRVARFAEIERVEPRYKLFSKYYQSEHFPSFTEAVDIELRAITSGKEEFVEPGIVRRGFYVEQLEHWLSIFDRRKFLFLEQENLRGNSLEASLKRITKFLGITTEWKQFSTTCLLYTSDAADE